MSTSAEHTGHRQMMRWMVVLFALPMGISLIMIGAGQEVVAIGLAAALLALTFTFSLKGQVLLILITLPFEYQGIDVGFANVGPYDLATMIFVLGLGLRLIVGDRQRFLRQRILGYGIIMLVCFMLSFINSEYLGASVKEMIRLSLGMSVAYGLFVYLYRIRQPEFLMTILKIFVLEISLLALFGVFQAYTSSSIIQLVRGRVAPEVFGDVNFYASYLVVAISIVLGTAMVERKPLMKAVLWVSSAVLIVSLVLTISRSGLLGLAVVLLFFVGYSFFQMKGIRRFTTGIIVVSFIISMIALPFTPMGRRAVDAFTIANRFESTLSGSDKSVIERSKILEVTWKAIEAHPVLGLGIGAFEESFNAYRGNLTEVGSARSVHNTPARVLAETGVIGFVAFCAFVFALFSRLWRSMFKTRDHRWRTIQFSLFTAISAYAVTSLTLDQLSEAHIWVIVGLALAGASFSRNIEESAHLPQNIIS